MNDQKFITARASFVHNSPRKLRLVADAVRKMKPEQAVGVLSALPQRAVKPVLQVFIQAIANAKNNFKASPGDLEIASLQIEEGPRGPRKPDVHSHGARFDRGIRRKRLAHIKLQLVTKESHGTKS
jgi:large subunit ribosomal protein L22